MRPLDSPRDFFESGQRQSHFSSVCLCVIQHPFAGLIEKVSIDTPRVLINAEKVGEMDEFEPRGMFGRYREEGFDFEGSTRGGEAESKRCRFDWSER